MKTAEFYAEQVLVYACAKGIKITHLKLQKVLFFLQYLHLVRTDKELFNDKFCAFKYGPVVYEVFAKYAGNGNLPLKPSADAKLQLLPEVCKDLDVILPFSAWALVDISHKAGGAWDKIYRKDALADIPPQLVQEDAKKGLYNELCI